MAIVVTRPFSPKPGEPFTGYFCYVNSSSERSVIEVTDGTPKVEPVELAPGRYSIEWIEAEKEPVFDIAVVPDEPEVELKDICNSLKGEPVDESVKDTVPNPEQTSATVDDSTATTDQTVASQPPATEQEVAPSNVSTKRKGSADV